MADFSIIELVVYGLIGYSGILVLIVSVLLNPPTNQTLAGARVVWLSASVVALIFLSFTGGVVGGETITISENTTSQVLNASNNNSVVLLNTTTERTDTKFIQLGDPVWVLFHFALAMIIVVYILTQTLNIFTKT